VTANGGSQFDNASYASAAIPEICSWSRSSLSNPNTSTGGSKQKGARQGALLLFRTLTMRKDPNFNIALKGAALDAP